MHHDPAPHRPANSGAVSSGHEETTAAALFALEAGGNAFDALVAGALAAGVCEPLLTGFGGGGLMTLRDGATGQVTVAEFFPHFPGRDHGLLPRDFRAIEVDYGPTTQVFHSGIGAVAPPTVALGLEHVARSRGRLPLRELVRPAVRLARDGWLASRTTQVVAEMLEAITTDTPRSGELFAPGGRPLREGAVVRSEAMATALEIFGAEGAAPFRQGRFADLLLQLCGPPRGSLGRADLDAMAVRESKAIAVSYHGATLYLPGPPSTGGALLAFGLQLLARLQTRRDPLRVYRTLTAVMRATEQVRAAGFDAGFFEEGAVEALLHPAHLDRWAEQISGELRRRDDPTRPARPGPPQGSIPGNTTHISVVDGEGNAASYTSSNGETCGTLWPGTDFPINNFLGELDIHPLGFHRGPPGGAMRTMMTPALLETSSGGLLAIGTGGSNRIRTAMLQVVRGIVDEGLEVEEAVMRPRIHVEGDTLQVEDVDLGPGLVEGLRRSCAKLASFPERHLYFGGVHCAFRRADGSYAAMGDPRRSGVGGVRD